MQVSAAAALAVSSHNMIMQEKT